MKIKSSSTETALLYSKNTHSLQKALYMIILGYLLAILVGVSLGLIGSGGSILTVPILVYIMGINPILATAYSLFIVGSTSLIGGIQNLKNKNADIKTVLIFGLPSIFSVYLTRAYLLPAIPEELWVLPSFILTKNIGLMLLFAVVMIGSSLSMILPSPAEKITSPKTRRNSYFLILAEGLLVGVLTGLVGAGGGFLIIPALVLLAGMPMKRAVGTSLLIIAAKSLLGFLGDLQANLTIDWKVLLVFTFFSIIGILIGIVLSKKINGEKLKSSFGYFVLIMGIYIIVNELFF